MDTVLIDGSLGEGGGQVLRTSVALSALTGKSVRISNIRLGRSEAGLKPQHVAAVKAVADLCGAQTDNVCEGSLEIGFVPGDIRAGKIKADIKTAGSVTLVLQALLLPSFFAGDKVILEVRGGTDVNWSPSVDYFRSVFLKAIGKAGFNANLELNRRGYHPAGGGKVGVDVFPAKNIVPFDLSSRGKILSIQGLSHAHQALAKGDVALRQAKNARTQIYNVVSNHGFKGDINISLEYSQAESYGCGITVWANAENSVLGVDALGEKSKRAEQVGSEAAKNLIPELLSNAALDKHMADQIIPYLAVAGGRVTVSQVTPHTSTNVEVANKFGFDVRIDGNMIVSRKTLF